MMFLTNLLYWFLWIIFFLLHLNYKFKIQKTSPVGASEAIEKRDYKLIALSWLIYYLN